MTGVKGCHQSILIKMLRPTYIYVYISNEKKVRTEIILILCMIKDLRQMSKCTFHHKYTIKEDAELLDLLHPFKKEGSYEERRKI